MKKLETLAFVINVNWILEWRKPVGGDASLSCIAELAGHAARHLREPL